jgi:hypothetical protein
MGVGTGLGQSAFVNPDADRMFTVLSGAFSVGQTRVVDRRVPQFSAPISTPSQGAVGPIHQGRGLLPSEALAGSRRRIQRIHRRQPRPRQRQPGGVGSVSVGRMPSSLEKIFDRLGPFSRGLKNPRTTCLRAEALLGSAYCYLGRRESPTGRRVFRETVGVPRGVRFIAPGGGSPGVDLHGTGRIQKRVGFAGTGPDDPACLYYRGVCQRSV